MTYIVTPFPEDISRGAVGGPGWATTVVITAGGYRYGNQTSEQALCRFDVSHAARSAEKFARLLAFFRAARGPLYSFPFRDWSDYQATSAEGGFVSLGGGQYQMVKNYTVGTGTTAVTHARTILKPIVGTISIDAGTSTDVDFDTGIVLGTTSGGPTTWAGEFWTPCVFEVDQFRGEIIDGPTAERIMGWSGIQIVETRNP